MNKSPINYLFTAALGAVLWVLCCIIFGSYLAENPTLTSKDPAQLATELQIVFGIGVLLSIFSALYWYSYGSKEATAGELPVAKRKWYSLFIFQIVLSVILIVILVVINRSQGIEPKWFGIYYCISALLTFLLFWIATFLMSPRTVKFIPLGK